MSANANDKMPKKRGKRGDFQGLRLEFLTVNQERYGEASKKSKTPEFWRRLFKVYWRHFHWCLAFSEDPRRGEDAEPIEAIAPLEEPEVEVAGAIERKIKSWYNYRRTSTGLAGNLFATLLKSLRLPDLAPPRHIPYYQFYMQHPEFRTQVQEEFLVQGYGERAVSLHISLRCKVVQDMLADETEHNAAGEGLPSVKEEDQALARSVITLLLSSLREYTGYSFTLLAGRVDQTGSKPEFQVACQDGKDVIFPVWDPKVYKVTLSLFTKFVWAAGATTTTNTTDPPPDLGPDVDDLPQALISLLSTTERDPPENNGDRTDSNALPVTQATQPACILDLLLERQIAAIEDPEERGRWRRELMCMNAYNLLRETNIARNKELLVSMGLHKSFDEMMGTGKKCKAAGGGQKKRGAQAQEKDSGEDEANSEEEEEESDSQLAPRALRPVRAVTQKTSAAASATPSKTWKEDRAQLETTDLGDAFKGLVNSWWDYESGKGFVAQIKQNPDLGQDVS
ncbi:hypothetical protein B0H13DRAFT_2342678 [Mycena leptocephala]|nr:hypothetical protein B0H13DRAFT_2342678 [Mycena leptocephala]